jgi:site-specific DNA-cytosine methylase
MKWEDDGALRGECSMRNTGESPNVAVESRLSQILEATPHGKYCLSAKACQGILRRAERRGKYLPPVLKAVLLTQSESGEDATEAEEVCPSLQARMGTGGNQIPLTYQKTTGTLSPGAHAGSYNGQDAYNDMLVVSSEIHPALRAKANDPYRTDMAAYVASVDCRNFREGGETNGTLQAKESGGQSLNLNNTIRQNRVVRRLTPLECERLQGFPDHWTDLGEWTDSNGKRHKDADSPRYKALGNSIALPPWKWLLKRLCGNYERDATMASLFDGIGGFPLIWEQLNRRGTCLWASEIEEFPMAVTRRRFGTAEVLGDMGRFLFPCGEREKL